MMFMCAVLVKKGRIFGIQMRGFLDPPKMHNLRARFNFQTTPSSPFLLLIGWKPEVEIPEVKMLKSVTSDMICWKTGNLRKSEVNIMCAGIDDDEKNGVALDEIFDKNDAFYCYFLKI